MRGLHTCKVSDLQMLVFPSSSDKSTNGVALENAERRQSERAALARMGFWLNCEFQTLDERRGG